MVHPERPCQTDFSVLAQRIMRPLNSSGAAKVCFCVCFRPTIGANELWVLKHLIDLRVAFLVLQLTSMQITMFFRILTTCFRHKLCSFIWMKP